MTANLTDVASTIWPLSTVKVRKSLLEDPVLMIKAKFLICEPYLWWGVSQWTNTLHYGFSTNQLLLYFYTIYIQFLHMVKGNENHKLDTSAVWSQRCWMTSTQTVMWHLWCPVYTADCVEFMLFTTCWGRDLLLTHWTVHLKTLLFLQPGSLMSVFWSVLEVLVRAAALIGWLLVMILVFWLLWWQLP